MNKKGRLEQAIEREPHVEHIENCCMLILKKTFSLYFFGCLTPNGLQIQHAMGRLVTISTNMIESNTLL